MTKNVAEQKVTNDFATEQHCCAAARRRYEQDKPAFSN